MYENYLNNYISVTQVKVTRMSVFTCGKASLCIQ